MPRKTKPVTQKTLVTFLLDRTRSMQSCKASTIEAFNAYLKSIREVTGLAFTFLQFDSISLDKVCVAEPVAKVPLLNEENYQPRSMTPLIDAAYKTIKAVEESLTKHDDKPKVVICIQTDGEENASREHTWDQLNDLIKEKSEAGWQFNFMGAGIDAYKTGMKLGIAAAQTMSYDPTQTKTVKAAFAASGASLRRFASGESHDTSYLAAERASAGDAFAHGHFGTPVSLDLGGGSDATSKRAIEKIKKIVDDVTL